MVKVTYTVDPSTVSSVRELSAEWGVPQSEVIRRVVRQAKHQRLMGLAASLTPLEVLAEIEHQPTLSSAEGKARVSATKELRKAWRSNDSP